MVENIFTPAEQALLSDAIAACEKETSAELVVMAVVQSDTYSDIACYWSLLIASLGTWCLWWTEVLQGFPALWVVQALLFLATLIVLQEFRLSVKLAPDVVKRKRAEHAAAAQFTLHHLTHTTGRTGVLLYVSVGEHYAEIRADQAVNDYIPQEVWENLIKTLLHTIPREGLVSALSHTIHECGVILKPYLPRHENDINELPDIVH